MGIDNMWEKNSLEPTALVTHQKGVNELIPAFDLLDVWCNSYAAIGTRLLW